MKLAMLAAALMLPGAGAPPAPAAAPDGARPPVAADSFDRMNLYREQPGCRSIPDQVAGEDRRNDGTRLDRLPQGRALLAVERQVDGCREAVLVSEERRRQRR